MKELVMAMNKKSKAMLYFYQILSVIYWSVKYNGTILNFKAITSNQVKSKF